MFINDEEAVLHTVSVILAAAVFGISVVAAKRRGGRRYKALSVAFLFLALGEVVQFIESYSLNSYIYVPVLNIHLSHLLDLAMLTCFGFALLLGGRQS
jgi:hypothetical protein